MHKSFNKDTAVQMLCSDARAGGVQNYNQTRHDHEIMLESQTQIQDADDDEQNDIPRMLYNVRHPFMPSIRP